MTTPNDKPDNHVIDLSSNALSIARELDRLPIGFTYCVTIEKDDMRSLPWRVEIVREEVIVRRNYLPE